MKTQLGHYEIVAELGRGGMGVVYKGYEPALNRHVAIKELSPSLANDASLVERFLREARSMAALNDPHIIQIYFIGQENGQPFFVMEFVEGESLSQALRREGKLKVGDALKIMHETAQGLATAHDRGVVHRDIKPGNLMLTSKGRVKIADFGIALATQDISKKLTSTGEFVGTPGYLSPEVCLAKPIDQRSDIFSLGIVLFEMLSGRMPFSDESPLGLMLEVVKAEIPDIREINSEVDAQTYAILSRMVAKDPADRFQSCHDLAAALSAHPEVARGGGLSFRVGGPPPASDATVIGAPTPASQQRRAPTPPPEVGTRQPTPLPAVPPTPAPAAAAAAAPVNEAAATRPGAAQRPSVVSRPAGSGGWKLPVAIAAAVLILVGGTAFAFRDYLTGFVGGYRDGFVAGTATNPVPPSSAGTLDPAPTQPDGLSSSATQQTAATGSTEGAATSSTLSADGLVAAPAQPEGGVSTSGSAVEAEFPNVSAPASTASTVAAAPASDASGTSAPIASSGSQAPAASTAAAEPKAAPTQVATREPPRPVAPPRDPRILVVAMGDNAITSPAAQRMEQALSEDGFDILDASILSGVDRFVDSGDLAGLLDHLQRRNMAEVVLVVRAEPVGTQELQYYGRSSTQYTAFLGTRAYLVAEKRPLGPGFRKQVQFTSLNAAHNANEAMEGELMPLLRALRPYKPRGRG
jgi:eukaryotic-like serine/threonine-protein kinase